MRAIVQTEPGKLELNYMWLPTWIGLNNAFKEDLECELTPVLLDREIDEDLLDEASDMVLDFIEKKFPNLKGLRDYLDGLKFVVEE